MIRRFTSGPKPAARVRLYIDVQIAVAVDAQAVADAVEAGEVRRRLGGRDQVVGRQRVRRVRQPARLDGRAEPLGQRERLIEALADAGLDPALAADQLLGHAEPDAAQVLAGRQPDLLREARARSSRTGPGRPCARSSSAASVTSRVSGPAWSSDEANAIIP